MKNLVIIVLLCCLVILAQETTAQLRFEEVQNDTFTGLIYPRSLTISPDGKHIYVVGNSFIGIFQRFTETGEILFIEGYKNGGTDSVGNLISGLNGPLWIAVSPDGKHVYFAANISNSVVVFSRDSTSGKLTFVDFIQDGGTDESGNLIDGLNTAHFVTVSHDGKHVYVSGVNDRAIAVFSRDEKTGKMLFVECLKEGGVDGSGNSIEGLSSNLSICISGDGRYAYATGRSSNDNVYSVSVFARNDETGKLTFVEILKNAGTDGSGNEISGLKGCSSAAISSDDMFVYTTSGDHSIVIFKRDIISGKLTFIEYYEEGATTGPRSTGLIIASKDGKHVYTSAIANHSLAEFSRDEVTGKLTFVEILKDGVSDGTGNTIDGLRKISSIIISPDNNHIYATGRDDHALSIFKRMTSNGKLTYLRTQFDGVPGKNDGLYGAGSVVVPSDGKHVYVAGRFENAIAVFSRNKVNGKLSFVEALKEGKTDGSGNIIRGLLGIYAISVTDDGNHIYTTGEQENTISVFSRENITGRLTFVESHQHGSFDESGNQVIGIVKPRSVTISNDGKNVYFGAFGSEVVTAFGRDKNSGKLTFIEANNLEGIIEGISSVTASPDGAHIYAVHERAIILFNRNLESGKLTFVESLYNKQSDSIGNIIESLIGATSVTVTPDGKHVYVASNDDEAVVVFNRDLDSGKLTFNERLKNGLTDESDNLISGLNGATSVAVSDDGKDVYAVGEDDDALVVFSRDLVTGKLIFVESLKDGLFDRFGNEIDGLNRASWITISPDSKHIYTTGLEDESVVLFKKVLPDVELISKTASNNTPAVDDTILYTIVTRNNGPGLATNVIVTDSLTAGMAYVPGSITHNGLNKTDIAGDDNADFGVTEINTVTVKIGDMTDGQIDTVRFKIIVNGTPGTTIENTAVVSSENDDSPNNNKSSITILPITHNTYIANNQIKPVAQLMYFDFANSRFQFDLAIKNNSNEVIVPPFFVQILSITTDPPGPPVTINNADFGGNTEGSGFNYSNSLGDDNKLNPGEITAFKTWIFDDPGKVNFSFFANVFGSNGESTPFAKIKNNEPIQFYVDVKNQDITIINSTTTVNETTTPEIPKDFDLHQNFPNPFNPETKINYQIPMTSYVTLTIFNLQGQEIHRLINENKEAGYHEVTWNARNNYGKIVPSGLYVYRIQAGKFTDVKKMVLLW